MSKMFNIIVSANRPSGELIKGGCYDYDPDTTGNLAAIMQAKRELNAQGGGVIFLVECWETSERQLSNKIRVNSSTILPKLNKVTDSWNYLH